MSLKGKNYLVVGGLGYIGIHLTQLLIDGGANVIILDDFSSAMVTLSGLKDYPFVYRYCDIRDSEDIQSTIQHSFDCVFHFAGFKDAGASMTKNGVDRYITNNVLGSIQLLNQLKETGTKNFVFSSSAAVYGTPEHLPITEHHPLNPTTTYGETKLIVEKLLKWYSKCAGLNYAALRYFNAAGGDPESKIVAVEKTPANLIPRVMEAAVHGTQLNVYGNDYKTPDGTCIRDYIHVRDLAVAHIQAADFIENTNQNLTVNLGSENGYSVLNVIKMVEEITGRFVNFEFVGRRAGDVPIVIASSDKAKVFLDWKASYSDLETIIETQWNIYEKVYEL